MSKLKSLGGAACAMVAFLLAPSLSLASIIAEWTFETSIPTTAGPLSPETGSGSGTLVHATAGTISNPSGNGSAESWSSTRWAVNDYYQFQTSTTGLSDIYLSWDQTSSSTGPRDFQLSYSTDGSTFTPVGSPTIVLENGATPNAAWNSTTYIPAYTYIVPVSALDNQANAYFRLTQTSTIRPDGAPMTGTAGANRVDNVRFSDGPPPAIPEPASIGLLLGSTALLGIRRRRSR